MRWTTSIRWLTTWSQFGVDAEFRKIGIRAKPEKSEFEPPSGGFFLPAKSEKSEFAQERNGPVMESRSPYITIFSL